MYNVVWVWIVSLGKTLETNSNSLHSGEHCLPYNSWCSFGEFGIGSTKNPQIDIFLNSHYFSAWHCFWYCREKFFLGCPQELMKGLMTSATETLVYDICLLQTVNWLTLTVNWLRVIVFIRGGTKNTCIFLSMWERTCSLGTRLINYFFTSLFRWLR